MAGVSDDILGGVVDELRAAGLLVLDRAPLELAGRVAMYGRLPFDDDPPARVAWEATTREIWLDERPRIELARRDFAAGAARRGRRLGPRVRSKGPAGPSRRSGPVEGCMDAADRGPPVTNADAMQVLGRHGVLEPSLATAMAAGARFRNVLVHGYATVDDGKVLAYLDELGTLDRFVAAVGAFTV